MRKDIKNGFFSGAVASLCCLGPTLLIMFGIGAVFGITSLCYSQYRPQFFALGLSFLFMATFIYFRNRKINACELNTRKKTEYIAVSIISMLVIYTIFIIFVIPYVQSSILNVNSCSV
jgi:hypothetical protein